MLGQRRQGQRAVGRVEQPGPDACVEHARQHDGPRRVGAGHQQHRQFRRPRSPAPRSPARAGRDGLRELRRHRRDDEQQHRSRQVDEAGLDRRQPEHRLQVQRDVEEQREERRSDRDDGELRSGEARFAQQAAAGASARVERSWIEREHAEQDGGAGERRDDQRAAPAVAVAAQQREDQQEQAADQGDLARPVDGASLRVAGLGDAAQRDRQGDDSDRDVDQEDRAPAEQLGQPAADEWPDGKRGADRRPECGQGLRALLARSAPPERSAPERSRT